MAETKIHINQSFTSDSNTTNGDEKAVLPIESKPSEIKEEPLDESKNFVHVIKEKVLNQSESTLEDKEIDIEYHYRLLIQSKELSIQIFKNSVEDGLVAFQQVNKDLDYILTFIKDKETTVYKKYMELKKLIFSNIANCLSHLSRIEESIRVDETVNSSLID